MKKLLLILLCLPMIGFGQLTYVPDDNFEQALINLGYDNILDDYVTTASIDTISNLDINSQGIIDITGISDFQSLTHLICHDNYQLTFPNFSSLHLLEYLDMRNSGYGLYLDFSSNHFLTYLNCSEIILTGINLNNNLALSFLDCQNNNLPNLDVSNNINLDYLDCSGNGFTFLDVSNNILLKELRCGDCQLTGINTNGANSLEYLAISGQGVNNGNNCLTSLDLTSNISLKHLSCIVNFNLNSLDLSNNIALEFLSCGWTNISVLDLSNNVNLEFLNCKVTQIISLDVSNNPNLYALDCSGNQQLSELNVRNGNNSNFFYWHGAVSFYAQQTPNLTCINVDDVTWSTLNWNNTNLSGLNVTANIDPQHYFSTNCSGPSAIEYYTSNKRLLKVTDLLGREIKRKNNKPLFYIYEDGTVEKRIIIE